MVFHVFIKQIDRNILRIQTLFNTRVKFLFVNEADHSESFLASHHAHYFLVPVEFRFTAEVAPVCKGDEISFDESLHEMMLLHVL